MGNICTVTIGGHAVTIREGSLSITSRVDDKDKAVFTVLDPTGTAAFNKGQPVKITDSQLGLLFSGFINKPTMVNLYPNPDNEWSIDCVNKFVTLSKKAAKPTSSTGKRHKGGKHKNQHSGTIVANQIKEYVEPEGVSGSFGLDWTELQTDWASGTLSGVAATTNASTGNTGAGDLELAPVGAGVSFTLQSQADFGTSLLANTGLSSPVSGGITFNATPAIKFQATEALPGVANPSTYVKIWDNSLGSYTIPSTNPTLFYDIWLPDTCPQQMAGVEIVCTDGTSFVASQSQWLVDQQGVGGAPNNDLSGLATNQWYSRILPLYGFSSLGGKQVRYVAIAFGGSSQGNYTAYLRKISIAQNDGVTNLLTVFGSNATSIAITPQQLQNSGYSTMSCTLVTSYERTGRFYGAFVDLTSASIAATSYLNWDVTLPNNNFTCDVEASIDSYASWQASSILGSFLVCSQQTPIPGILPGMNLSGVRLNLRYNMTNNGNDPTLTPVLNNVMGVISSAPACTKSDIVSTTNTSTGWSAGTLTNLVVATNYTGAVSLQLNGVARNYDDANYGNQTTFGLGFSSQGVTKRQFFLTCTTASEARSRLDFAGQWANFTAEVDFQASTSFTPSFVYRTTGWQNNDSTWGYVVEFNGTTAKLNRGTNSASGTGSSTTVSSVSLTLSNGTWYRLKVIANGSSHQIYVNDVLIINATDATYTGAGYVGLRNRNGSASTQTAMFDNFGIMAALSGTWVSPAIDIHSLGSISNSQITLRADQNDNFSLSSFLVEISLNNGVSWTTCTNTIASNGFEQITPLPGLTNGTNVSSMTQVKIRLTITSTTAASGSLPPDVFALSFYAIGAYSSTGTRTNAPVVWDSVNRLPVASGWGNTSDGLSYTQVGTGATATNGSEATITNTTGDVVMVPASVSTSDTDASVRFQISTASELAGIDLRRVDANNYYRLQATQNSLTIFAVNGGHVYTLATAAPTIAPGAYYWLRFQVIGNGPITLNGRVWQDGQPEPLNAWNVTFGA